MRHFVFIKDGKRTSIKAKSERTAVFNYLHKIGVKILVGADDGKQ